MFPHENISLRGYSYSCPSFIFKKKKKGLITPRGLTAHQTVTFWLWTGRWCSSRGFVFAPISAVLFINRSNEMNWTSSLIIITSSFSSAKIAYILLANCWRCAKPRNLQVLKHTRRNRLVVVMRNFEKEVQQRISENGRFCLISFPENGFFFFPWIPLFYC